MNEMFYKRWTGMFDISIGYAWDTWYRSYDQRNLTDNVQFELIELRSELMERLCDAV